MKTHQLKHFVKETQTERVAKTQYHSPAISTVWSEWAASLPQVEREIQVLPEKLA